jgi:NodT family efflux transporter outer membrane factor (OMF) lipoprotein
LGGVGQKQIKRCFHTLANKAGVTLAFAGMMLSGCASMSGIVPQSHPIQPQQLEAGAAIASASAIAWPKEAWWETYQDPQLNQLVQQAISGSPTLRMAAARVEMAKAYAQSTHAETLPNVSGDASVTRERFTALQFIPPPWAGNVDWNNQMTASLSYDLDLWGRQTSLWSAALDEQHAVAAEVQQVKLGLTTAVVRTYVQLSKEYALNDIAEQHLRNVEARIAILQRSRVAGLSTQMEVMESESAIPLAREQREVVQEHIAVLKNQLAALTGQGPGAGDRIARPAMKLDARVGLPEQLPANLVARRPDIIADQWRIEGAQQHIASAKAAFYPNINLMAFVGFQALGFSQLVSSAANMAGVGPAISLPIFDGGRRRAQLSGNTAGYDMAVEHYNETVVHALQEVSDQLVILQSNEKQYLEAENALDITKKADDLAVANYRAGLSNYLHVLETHSAVLKQQENLDQLQAARLEAYAGLMRALGGGTMDAQDKSAQEPNR